MNGNPTLARIGELIAAIPKNRRAESPLGGLNDPSKCHPLKLHRYQIAENDLRSLDQNAWEYLRDKARRIAVQKHKVRRWQALFDCLDEAKGYSFLRELGCDEIKFVPTSKTKTPDLQARLDGRLVLCEVKTINASDDGVGRRNAGGIQRHENSVSDKLLAKVARTVESARDQILEFASDRDCRKIVFLILMFDDLLREYAPEYDAQVRAYVSKQSLGDVEVELFWYPPFWSAGAQV